MKRKKHRNDGQRKRGKGVGYEYRSARAGPRMQYAGRDSKRRTHRAERREGKRAAK